jgi:hypothetical protein
LPHRNEFTELVKRTVAGRVGYLCSKCRNPTIGPNDDSAKTILLGEAAHITAATAGGPRYDPALSEYERKSVNNAIWLCTACHTLIDALESTFSSTFLHKLKREAEQLALDNLSYTRPILKVRRGIARLELNTSPTANLYIQCCDLVSALEDLFRPRKAEIELYSDYSGIDFIKIIEGSSPVFELFDRHSTPTAIDLLNSVFAVEGGRRITGILGTDVIPIGAELRRVAFAKIAKKYGLDQNGYPMQWLYRAEEDESCRLAHSEWNKWYESQLAIRIIFDGDEDN